MNWSKITFIINPRSGKKKAENLYKKLRAEYPGLNCRITKDLDDFDAFMKKHLETYSVFVIAGGDGSINSAVKYLAGRHDKVMAVYPTGSGNGFARELGFQTNLDRLFQHIKRMKTRSLDLLEVNGEYCANMAGLGFDAAVAHTFAKLKKRGFWSYLKLVIKMAFSFPAFEVDIQYANQTIHRRCLMLSIANTRQFGNNALIAPQAKPDDGIADIALLKDCSRFRLPIFGIRMMTGCLKPSKCYGNFRTASDITIQTDFKQYHIDGDPREFDKELKVKISNKKIQIIDVR